MKPEERIMGAYYRMQGGENRATEMLATVLNGVPGYLDRLAERVGLQQAARYQMETQVRVPGSVIDLEIRAETADGQPVWLLWSEHKVRAPFSKEQLTRYAGELRKKAGVIDSRMIAVTLDAPSPEIWAEAEGNQICLLRWRDLLGLAEKVGKDIAGPSWRVQNRAGSDELARRLLLDWLTFYREELEEVAMEPLTRQMAEVLPEAVKAINVVDRILEGAFETACEAIGAGRLEEEDDYFCAVPPAGTWLASRDCVLYAKVEVDEAEMSAVSDKPFFKAGMFVRGEPAEALRDDSQFRQTLDEGDFFAWDEDTGRKTDFDVARGLPISEVVKREDLDGQEKSIRELCLQTFQMLIACPLDSEGPAAGDKNGVQ